MSKLQGKRGRRTVRPKALTLEHLIGADPTAAPAAGAGRPRICAISDADLLAVVKELTDKGASHNQALHFLANYLVIDKAAADLEGRSALEPGEAWDAAQVQLEAEPSTAKKLAELELYRLRKLAPDARAKK